MRYWIISAIIVITLFAVGCGNKVKNNEQTNETDGGNSKSTGKETEGMSVSKTEAIHLGKSLYLILEEGKLDESHLVELDTGEETFGTRAVITFDMVDKTGDVPAKAKAENAKLSDREAVTNLKVTFELAYAIKSFLGEKAALVDVRTPEEYADGHAQGAELIPVDEIAGKVTDRFEKDDVITVYCRSGNRSATAQAVLEQDGYLVLDIGGIGEYKGELEK